MKLLAVNTSSILSAALFSRNEVLAERNFYDTNRFRAEDLPLVLEELLPAAGWQPREITHVAVALGPGGYTGLRSGLALAKTLAQMNDIPVIGVNSLEAMAVLGPEEGLICPVLDAKMKELNWALYRKEKGNLGTESEPSLSSFPVMLERIAASDGPVLFLGEPLISRKDEIRQRVKNPLFAGEDSLNFPLARGVGSLALKRIIQGETSSWNLIEPFYARPPVL